MIIYSLGLVVDCSSESAGRENSKGYSFVVRSVSNGISRSGREAGVVEEDVLPAGDER